MQSSNVGARFSVQIYMSNIRAVHAYIHTHHARAQSFRRYDPVGFHACAEYRLDGTVFCYWARCKRNFKRMNESTIYCKETLVFRMAQFLSTRMPLIDSNSRDAFI